MLKPSSGLCNMRCSYCFYTDEMRKRKTASYGMMTADVLECVIRKALAATTVQCTIAFQGGEPTLAGIPFFRAAVRFATQHNPNGCEISYALQTNGLLLDDEWCAFLAENHFLVGVSLDGTQDLHDANRPDANGEGTFERVMASIHLL